MTQGKKTGGRQAGTPNKRTAEIEALARSLIEDPVYQRHFKERLTKGTLPPVLETMLWYYAYGKPIKRIESQSTVTHLLEELQRMSDAELLALLASSTGHSAIRTAP